jgi:hypothetical protein
MPLLPEFTRYVALGDGMSTDDTPTCDIRNVRTIIPRLRLPLGAASLLFRNYPQRWPDFAGRDLGTRYPTIAFSNLAREGATLATIARQLDGFPAGDRGERLLLSLTAGGQDLLAGAGGPVEEVGKAAAEGGVIPQFTLLVETIMERLPSATLIVTTLPDMAEQAPQLARVSDFFGRVSGAALRRFNQQAALMSQTISGLLLADLHAHFRDGRFLKEEVEQWYWRHSLVEPSARSASEIRRVWLEALGM